jgi:hypothetical protein
MIAPKRVQRERKEAAGPERCMPVSIVFSWKFLWYRRVGFILIVDGCNQNARLSLCMPSRARRCANRHEPCEKLEGQFEA